MIDRYSSDLRGAELRALRDTANKLVRQRDSARAWAVRCESLLEAACKQLLKDARWPCLNCHQGEQDSDDNPEPFHPSHHDPACEIAQILADADTERGAP